MPNPKRKHTRARRDSRRAANWRLELGSQSDCKQCGNYHPPHRVCPSCGFYDGNLIVPKVEKKKGKEKGDKSKGSSAEETKEKS